MWVETRKPRGNPWRRRANMKIPHTQLELGIKPRPSKVWGNSTKHCYSTNNSFQFFFFFLEIVFVWRFECLLVSVTCVKHRMHECVLCGYVSAFLLGHHTSVVSPTYRNTQGLFGREGMKSFGGRARLINTLLQHQTLKPSSHVFIMLGK